MAVYRKQQKKQIKVTDSTIYNDVFRTIAEKMSPFFIPLINEVFGTKYSMQTSIHHDSETHMTLLGKRSTDSCFTVKAEWQYHVECQSNPDSTIVIRFFEYDVAIAIMEREMVDGKIHIRFPRSAVLYLRHTMKTPNIESMILEFADGSRHNYNVPVIKAQEYSLDEIFEKELYILLPFYLLRYEKILTGIDKREEDQKRIIRDYERINQWLSNKVDIGEFVTYSDINKLIMRIVEYLMKKEKQTMKGIGDAMGGKVLELYSEQVEREKQEKVQEGLAQGEALFATLTKKLLSEGRNEDLMRATSDEKYRKALYEEFEIKIEA